MPTKNIVKEILPEQLKEVNPLDIIYLAMKDGSIILISDNDEEKYDILDKYLDTEERKTNDILLSDKIEKSKVSLNYNSLKKPSEPFWRKKLFPTKSYKKNLNYTFNYDSQIFNTNLIKTESHRTLNLTHRDHSLDYNKTMNFEYKINKKNSKYTLDNNPFRTEREISQRPKIGSNKNYIGDNKHYYQMRGEYYKKENNNNSYSKTSNTTQFAFLSKNNIKSENLSLTYTNDKSYNNQKVVNLTQPTNLKSYLQDCLEKKVSGINK